MNGKRRARPGDGGRERKPDEEGIAKEKGCKERRDSDTEARSRERHKNKEKVRGAEG